MKEKARKIEKIILQNISDYHFSVGKLSELMDMSPAHLRDTVHYLFNRSPQNLIETIKVQKAIFMFTDGDSFYTMAKKLGFNNPRTFRRVVKKRLQLSPSACKEHLGRGPNGKKLKRLIIKLWDLDTSKHGL